MRLFLQLSAALALLAVVVHSDPVRRPGRALVNEGTWKVASESDDHITYVRRETEDTQEEGQKKDCNETTTTEAPQLGRRKLVSSLRSRGHLRSGAEGREHGSSWRKSPDQSRRISKVSAAPQKGELGSNLEGGDSVWEVSRRSDDHITYTRRASGSSSQGQDQGELRRLGTGRDSVYARVIVPGKDDEFTEEGLLEAHTTAPRRSHTRSRSRASAQTQSRPAGFTGFPTNELVHPYVKKAAAVNLTEGASSTTSEQHTRTRSRTKSLRSGGSSSTSRGGERRSSARPPITEGGEVDQFPRVGDILNGWIVISKSKDHISWDRVGATSSSSHAAVAHLRSGQSQQEDRLKSLKTGGDRRSGKSSAGKLIPNPQGELVEGFPRLFNTYSRALYTNDRNIDDAGSIRTSLSDTKNWKIGDELAGWKVISKDYRGIVWQRMNNATQGAQGGTELNEEDLIDELNRKSLNKGDEGEESSESDSSSESASNEGDIKEGENVYRGPPGTWYLAKETKNSITWKRDNVPADVVFEMNAYPRIGDIQTEWKVKSKSKEHITWVRIHRDGTEIESNEQEA